MYISKLWAHLALTNIEMMIMTMGVRRDDGVDTDDDAVAMLPSWGVRARLHYCC